MGKRIVAQVLSALVLPLSAVAADTAIYEEVADYVGVPATVLYAMALTESGLYKEGETIPWPWTLNIEGKARRYDTRQAMFEGLMAALGSGEMMIDVGLMQVNWHWQYDRLGSPWTITDPVVNLKVGASILKNHYADTGDWWSAVGRYHRPAQTPRHQAAALAYANRVKKLMTGPIEGEGGDV
jgi:soluble lytic murein transglycosylase-like protein